MGLGGGNHLKAKSEREGEAVYDSDFIWKILRGLTGRVGGGCQRPCGVDGDDVITAACEERVVSG